MIKNLTEWLTKPLITEDINIPVNVGDTILVGRFKNKKMKVKDIGVDKHGMPTINGRKATTFRMLKTDKVDECIAIAKKFGNDIVLGKNRDRNYNPNLKVVRELDGYGTEVCYVIDEDTDWSEGMNSYGIGLVNSALFVKRDEKDFDKAKKKKALSKDGTRIREALQHKNIKDVVKSLLTYQDGIKGHTIVSDGRKVVTIENTSRVKPAVKVHDINKEIIVRTNHGIEHPEQGYQRGPDKLSSQIRTKNALDILKKEVDYKKFFPTFYNHTQDKGAKYDLVRAQNKLWTSSQLMMNLNKKEITLYLIPGAVKFLGIENTLPNDYNSKIKLKVRQYEHGPSDKYDTYITTDKKKKKSAIKDKDTDVKEMLNKPNYIKNVAPTPATQKDGEHQFYNPKTSKKKKKNEEFGVGAIPSPSRKGINKNKTDKLSGYKKVDEATSPIKKVIGIYGGRFQPFGPHHEKTYEWLKKQVDEAYIVTSDLKKPPRHPMNFKEKVRHMVKMGIPSNRIIKETTPYQAKNTLKKFDERTTAVIYIFGKKDANRLKAGAYFDDYKRNKNKMVGYRERGYILTAPHQSVRVGGKEVSGTTIRDILGHPKLNDEKRVKLFKKLFGYYDKGVYNMITNKFKKLYEFYNIPTVQKLVKEVSALGATITASDLDDEGLYDFFNSFADYKRVSPKHAKILDWDVIDDIIDFDNATDPGFDYSTSTVDRVSTVTFGRTINQNTKNTDSVDDPFPKWQAHIQSIVDKMGWEVVKYFGEKEIKDKTKKIKDSPTFDMKDATKNTTKIKKMQESYMKDVMLLIEGGAYGHMAHPFDDNNLTFSDLKQIIINGLGGKLDREDNVTEKLDGQNLMISWVDGKLKAARNKGHLKNHGKTAPDTKGISTMFSGRGDIKDAFVGAMKDLEKSIGRLSDAQQEKVFGNGSKWMNLEVMYPKTANIIDYDVAEIVFHGAIEYDDSGKAIGQPRDSARMLEGMIRQVNANIQKKFKISKPNFLTVPKSQNFGKNKSRFLGKLKKLQSTYALKDTDKLGDYHQAYWREYVFNASKQFKVSLKPNQFVSLVNRWAYFDKSYKIADIKKDYKDKPKFLDWILSTDKNDIEKIFKQNIKPFEVLFFQVGAEILKNISGYMAASPEKATQKIRKEVTKALSDLKSGGDVDKLKKLKLQIEKLQAIGGLDAVVPSEGVVFKYKGKIYKFTGAFAPINQILGSLKFG